MNSQLCSLPDFLLKLFSSTANGIGALPLYRTLPVVEGSLKDWSSSIDVCTCRKLENDIKRGIRNGEVVFKNQSFSWTLSDYAAKTGLRSRPC
jgi:hypothetical protein